MASELERLLIKLEADTSQMRRALAEAERGVSTYEQRVDAKLSQIERRFRGMGSNVMGSMRGFAASIAGAAAAMSAIDAGATLSGISQQLGITVERYQELRNGAQAAGVAHSNFDQALNRLNTTMAGVRSRTGDFYEFLQTHYPTVLQQLRGTTDLEGAFRVLADATGRLSTAQDRGAMVARAFGEGNEELARALQGGAAGFDAHIARAREFGGVMSTETVAALTLARREIDGWATALQVAVGTTLANVRLAFETTRTAIANELSQVAPVEHSTTDLRGQTRTMRSHSSGEIEWLNEFNAAADRAAAEAPRAGAALDGLRGSAEAFARSLPILTGWGAKVERALEPLRVNANEGQKAVLQSLRTIEEQSLASMGRQTQVIQSEHTRQMDSLDQSLRRGIISYQQHETARVQLTLTTSQRLAEINKEDAERARESLRGYQDALSNSLTSAIDALIDGRRQTWKEFVSGMLADLAKVAARAQINNLVGGLFNGGNFGGKTNTLGAFANLIGGMGLPGFAGGGDARAGRPIVVGERRPEVFVPATAGRVVPMERYSSERQGGSGNVINIDARHAEIGVEERIAARLQEIERRRPEPAQLVEAHKRRFPTRAA